MSKTLDPRSGIRGYPAGGLPKLQLEWGTYRDGTTGYHLSQVAGRSLLCFYVRADGSSSLVMEQLSKALRRRRDEVFM